MLSDKFCAQRAVIDALQPGWHDECLGAGAPPAARVQLAADIMQILLDKGVPEGTIHPVGETLGGVDLCWDHLPNPPAHWSRTAILTLQDAPNDDYEPDGSGDTECTFFWSKHLATGKTMHAQKELRLTAEETALGRLAAHSVAAWMLDAQTEPPNPQ